MKRCLEIWCFVAVVLAIVRLIGNCIDICRIVQLILIDIAGRLFERAIDGVFQFIRFDTEIAHSARMQTLAQLLRVRFFVQTNDEFVEILDAHDQLGYGSSFAHHFRFVALATVLVGIIVFVEHIFLDVGNQTVDLQRQGFAQATYQFIEPG